MEKIFKLITFVLLSILLVSCDEKSGDEYYEGRIRIQIGKQLNLGDINCSKNNGFDLQSIIYPLPIEIRIFSSSNNFDEFFTIDFRNYKEMNLSSHKLTENIEVTFNFNDKYAFKNRSIASDGFSFYRKKFDVITLKSKNKEIEFGIEVSSSVWGNDAISEQKYILGNEEIISNLELE